MTGATSLRLTRVEVGRSHARLELVATAMLTLIGITGLLVLLRTYPGLDGDWASYRATLDRVLSGGPLYPAFQFRPYSLIDAARGAGYVYPPTSVPMLPLTADVMAWRLLNLVVLLAGTWAATRRPLTVALVLAFPGTWAVFANGNAMGLIVGLYGFAWAGPARWIAVIAAGIKVWPASLLILSWRRGEPMRWAILATAGLVAISIVGGYLPVMLNAGAICSNYPVESLHCASPVGSMMVSGLLLIVSVLVPSQRACFAALCLSVFALAPDWTWAYLLLPLMAAVPWLDPRERPRFSPAR